MESEEKEKQIAEIIYFLEENGLLVEKKDIYRPPVIRYSHEYNRVCYRNKITINKDGVFFADRNPLLWNDCVVKELSKENGKLSLVWKKSNVDKTSNITIIFDNHSDGIILVDDDTEYKYVWTTNLNDYEIRLETESKFRSKKCDGFQTIEDRHNYSNKFDRLGYIDVYFYSSKFRNGNISLNGHYNVCCEKIPNRMPCLIVDGKRFDIFYEDQDNYFKALIDKKILRRMMTAKNIYIEYYAKKRRYVYDEEFGGFWKYE